MRDKRPKAEKLVTELSRSAIDALSKKRWGDQVPYDRPFGNSFINPSAIWGAEEMRERVNRQGYRDLFGNPFSTVDDLLYALDADEAGVYNAEATVGELEDFIGDCTRCSLCETRKNVVHSEGDAEADVMVVGESPGEQEDRSGELFIGSEGKLLRRVIEAVGLRREYVFLTTVVRCHPPTDRPPSTREASTCGHFLKHEIALVDPIVIVTLGSTPTRYLLGWNQRFPELRGKFHDFHGIRVMPTFEPADLIADPSKKLDVWSDLKLVSDYLREARSSKS